eukprot:TRINITY_DN74120_c0_g1_i1.p1 TRINITY_DN74120_c0_g1~~TRINITY_DN74120_c0_g1_i1.p1  ORF type:complete len:756 (-),score=168.15 TRINITY_DN74120_c0_g1_i1:242-2509(-)
MAAEAMDAKINKLAGALSHVGEAHGSVVKLAKEEAELLRCVGDVRDSMMAVLLHCDNHRQDLRNVFGGDCTRISRIHAIMEAMCLSEFNAEDQRLKTCRSACESVEQVLQDLGFGQALREAQVRERRALNLPQGTGRALVGGGYDTYETEPAMLVPEFGSAAGQAMIAAVMSTWECAATKNEGRGGDHAPSTRVGDAQATSNKLPSDGAAASAIGDKRMRRVSAAFSLPPDVLVAPAAAAAAPSALRASKKEYDEVAMLPPEGNAVSPFIDDPCAGSPLPTITCQIGLADGPQLEAMAPKIEETVNQPAAYFCDFAELDQTIPICKKVVKGKGGKKPLPALAKDPDSTAEVGAENYGGEMVLPEPSPEPLSKDGLAGLDRDRGLGDKKKGMLSSSGADAMREFTGNDIANDLKRQGGALAASPVSEFGGAHTLACTGPVKAGSNGAVLAAAEHNLLLLQEIPHKGFAALSLDYQRIIRQLFAHYVGPSGMSSGSGLGLLKFRRFVRDCGLMAQSENDVRHVDGGLRITPVHADLALAAGAGVSVGASQPRLLSVEAFAAALHQVAVLCTPEIFAADGEGLNAFCARFLVPLADRLLSSLGRDVLAAEELLAMEPVVAELFRGCRQGLAAVFKKYATGIGALEPYRRGHWTAKAISRFATEAGFVADLSHSLLHHVFGACAAAEAENGRGAESKLSFSGFMLMLVVVAQLVQSRGPPGKASGTVPQENVARFLLRISVSLPAGTQDMKVAARAAMR